uniref:myosin XVB n=1 Tax=Euleptes europaea TaxID=460621 RepID=UPI00253FBFC5|nr:myosin XVB [Euleptes europaea]
MPSDHKEEYTQEELIWSPVSRISMASCVDLIAAKPHGILHILDDQTLLPQATDHTFLQKCHYHHANSPWYAKPKLPLPVFTVQHYAGPVTYQVHKFLNKNHDQLRPEVLEIFSQSHLKLVCSISQRVKELQVSQRKPGHRGQGPKHRSSTLVSRFQQSLQDLTAKLNRSHVFFVRCIKPNSKKDVQLLEIPAELAALLRLADGQHHGQINQVSPPEVKAKVDLSLPPNINTFSFSTFMKSHFQEASFPALGQPLHQPLTRLDAEHKQNALQLNKLILRFINEKDLQSWQEELLGNYIVRRGLASPSLRNELFSQVASQVWKNPNLEQCQRGWALMAALLGTFTPSPTLEKPLLKFVSDCGLDGCNAVCQRKLLTAMKQMEDDPEVSRAFPPTQLEWTANQRKGTMVLDVYTYEEEKLSAQVESWTTGEQYAGWILSSRGLDKIPRGWSVSMFTGKTWQDLPGCDFVLDLIGKMEEGSRPSGASPNYPITPERDESYSRQHSPDVMLLNIPPAPGVQAPSLPPDFDKESGAYPGYSGMMHVPTYQPMPTMGGMMPATMPMVPGLGGMGSMPAMVVPQPMLPSVDPSQLAAAQQQAFINQQALLMAQQMTLQAVTISQQQQEQERQRKGRSPESSRPSNKDVLMPDVTESLRQLPASIHVSQEKPRAEIRQDSISRGTFQKKIEYFQRMGQDESPEEKEPSKRRSPPRKKNSEDQEGSPERNAGPPPPPTQEDNEQEMKVNKALPPRVKHAELTPKSEPSKEIREIIKTHKTRPVPPPKPIMPTRPVTNRFVKKNDPKEEALTKLGIVGLSPSEPSSESLESSPQATPLPPPPPPPVKPSSTIKEKQLPLMNLFAHGPTSPPASGVPLPHLAPRTPPPAPSLSSDSAASLNRSDLTAMEENASSKTQLFHLAIRVCFSYANPTWKLFLRKEVFYPKENFSHPYCLNLLCDQIMRDTYSDSCIRISKEEKRKMKDLLTEFQVGMDASSIPDDGMKKRIVVAARDNWANYFSRLFPVKGENGSDVQILGVSHRGLRLLKRTKAANCIPEHLKILCSYSYAEVLSLEVFGRNIIQFSLKSEQLILHSPKARQIKAMVELFLHELKQDSNFVIALRSYMTDDKSLLNFKKGDFIRLLPMDGLESGWQFGSVGGRSGLFPSGLVQQVAAPDYLSLHLNRQEEKIYSKKVRQSEAAADGLLDNSQGRLSDREAQNAAAKTVLVLVDLTPATATAADVERLLIPEFSPASAGQPREVARRQRLTFAPDIHEYEEEETEYVEKGDWNTNYQTHSPPLPLPEGMDALRPGKPVSPPISLPPPSERSTAMSPKTRGPEHPVQPPPTPNSMASLKSDISGTTSSTSSSDICHYTMVEFAMVHFREAQSIPAATNSSAKKSCLLVDGEESTP